MAFTIRTLSIHAENNLERIKKEKGFISTNTKAVEYALEQYEYYKEFYDKYKIELNKNSNLSDEMNDIKDALQTLKLFTS